MSIMLNEFLAAPEVVKTVAIANKKVIADIAKEFKERGITNIATVARGTSDSAATYFKYIVEAIGEIVVAKLSPSITTIYGSKVNLKNSMALFSGMGWDRVWLWVLAGLPFDLLHGMGNFALGTLIIPIATLLKKLDKKA